MTNPATWFLHGKATRWPQLAMLAGAIALAIPAPASHATANARTARARSAPVRTPQSQLFVGNCDDSGPGSLRDTIAAAASGDTVDLSQLTCSTITLTSGQIEVPQDDLYIKYPGEGGTPPTIGASYLSRIFHHTGSGTLKLAGLTIQEGKYDNSDIANVTAYGGCIYSEGSVYLLGSTVAHCVAQDTHGYGAAGGGIYSWLGLTLIYSTISASTATSDLGGFGGGALTHGALNVEFSSISGNTAVGPDDSGMGGGVAMVNFGADPSLITNSTIDGNTAGEAGGLLMHTGGNGGSMISIVNSTISGNTSFDQGGAYLQGPVSLDNSTVAFNSGYRGILFGTPAYPVEFESSILAHNGTSDLGSLADVTISGANNLIMAIGAGAVVPLDTMDADPLLGPLADNGGTTLTHALGIGSPAIDAGNDVAGLATDQRGDGYPRVVGAAPDIGAIESEATESPIFANGFDP